MGNPPPRRGPPGADCAVSCVSVAAGAAVGRAATGWRRNTEQKQKRQRKKRAITSPTAQTGQPLRSGSGSLAHQSREIRSWSNGIGTNVSR